VGAIAQVLDDDGVRTRTGKGKWIDVGAVGGESKDRSGAAVE